MILSRSSVRIMVCSAGLYLHGISSTFYRPILGQWRIFRNLDVSALMSDFLLAEWRCGKRTQVKDVFVVPLGVGSPSFVSTDPSAIYITLSKVENPIIFVSLGFDKSPCN
jgi:hypothetical protein